MNNLIRQELKLVSTTDDILLANDDNLNLMLPEFARPFGFFHQAFWHFHK